MHAQCVWGGGGHLNEQHLSSERERPTLFMIPASTFSSIPSLTPRFIASEVPIIEIPRARLLQSFALRRCELLRKLQGKYECRKYENPFSEHDTHTSPVPFPPQCTMFAPIAPRYGWALENAESVPPTINVSVPASAPPTPPETGASIISEPCSSHFAATSRLTLGSIVEPSMKRVPLLAPLNNESSPLSK